MHGIVLAQLKDFVVETYDRETWRSILREAGLSGKVYVPMTEYPDEDVFAIIGTAADLTGKHPTELQAAFGRFLVGPLVGTYGVHVERNWTGLELIANVEKYIHEALRAKQLSTYSPPKLEAEWRGENRVALVYRSNRQLCHLARGIIDGVGDHFDESLHVEEISCMHEGDEYCELIVTNE